MSPAHSYRWLADFLYFSLLKYTLRWCLVFGKKCYLQCRHMFTFFMTINLVALFMFFHSYYLKSFGVKDSNYSWFSNTRYQILEALKVDLVCTFAYLISKVLLKIQGFLSKNYKFMYEETANLDRAVRMKRFFKILKLLSYSPLVEVL